MPAKVVFFSEPQLISHDNPKKWPLSSIRWCNPLNFTTNYCICRTDDISLHQLIKREESTLMSLLKMQLISRLIRVKPLKHTNWELESAHSVPFDKVRPDVPVLAVDMYLVPPIHLTKAVIAIRNIS